MQRREVNVLHQHAAGQQQRGHHPRERRQRRRGAADRSRTAVRRVAFGNSPRIDARRDLDAVEAPQPAVHCGRRVGARAARSRTRSSTPSSAGADARHRLQHLGGVVQVILHRDDVPPFEAGWWRRHAPYFTSRRAPRRVSLLYAGLALFVLLAALDRAQRLARLEPARRTGAQCGGVRARAAADAVAPDRGARSDRLAARAARRLPRATCAPADGLMFERLSDETERVPSELDAAIEGHAQRRARDAVCRRRACRRRRRCREPPDLAPRRSR